MTRYVTVLMICLFSLPWACKGNIPFYNKVPGKDSSIQAVVDQVSVAHYRNYQLDIESMGLGQYGGSDYKMAYRNRDYHPEKGKS